MTYIREIKPSEIRECHQCGVEALVPIDLKELDEGDDNSDGTTHVCHPALGGCNMGFQAVAPVTSLIVERGRRQLSFRKDGEFASADGPDGVKLWMLIHQQAALETEIRTDGQLKMTRGPHASFRLKKLYGYTGNRHAVYRQFSEAFGLEMKQDILDMAPKKKAPMRTKKAKAPTHASFTCPLCKKVFTGPTEASAIVRYEDHDCEARQ